LFGVFIVDLDHSAVLETRIDGSLIINVHIFRALGEKGASDVLGGRVEERIVGL